MKDNHSFSYDVSNCRKTNVQGPGGGMWVCVLSHVQLFATPWTVACQVPVSMGIFRARILEWVAIPLPRDLPHPGIEPASLVSPALAGGFFATVPPGRPGSGDGSADVQQHRGPHWSRLAASFSAFLGC